MVQFDTRGNPITKRLESPVLDNREPEHPDAEVPGADVPGVSLAKRQSFPGNPSLLHRSSHSKRACSFQPANCQKRTTEV